MNAGTLKGSVEFDLATLRASLATMVQMVDKAGKAMGEDLKVKADIDAKGATDSINGLTSATGRARDENGRFISSLKAEGSALRDVGKEAGSTSSALQSISVLGDAVQRVLSPLGLLPGHFGAIAARGSSLASTLSSVASGLTQSGGAFAGVSEALTTLAPMLSAAAPALVAVGTAAAVAAPFVAGFAASIGAINSTPVQLAAKMEQTKIAFSTLTGSAAQAEKTLQSLRQFADTTPFEFPEIAGAAKQLLAMGIGANQVTDALRKLGDISSGLGQPLGEMAYLFGQIKSQGRAMTQDLNQFAGRGVPIYAELAKVMHTNEIGVRAFAEEGKIGFAQVEAAITSMTSAGGKFAGLTEAQSQSLSGLQSTAADAFGSMETQIGDVLIKNLGLKESIKSVSDLIVASTPVVVSMFDTASKAAAPFTDLSRALVLDFQEVVNACNAAGQSMQRAFGVETKQSLVEVTAMLSPIITAVKLLTEQLEMIAKVIRFINVMAGAEGEMQKAVGSDEVEAKMAQKAKAAAAAKGVTLSDAEALAQVQARQNEKKKQLLSENPKSGAVAAVADAPAAGGVGSSGAKGSGASEAEKAAEARAKATAAAAKAQDEQSKALHESWARGDAANAKARADVLRAEGKDLEAKMLEIAERYKRSIAEAKTPFERDAQVRARDAEINSAKADDAEKQAKKKADAEKEAGETAKRTSKYQLDAQTALLEAQGRGQEAQLLKFDAEWKTRIDSIKDAGERDAAQQAYAAERNKKVAEIAAKGDKSDTGPGGSAIGRLPASVADAQQRVKAAKAGSGERELARLDLRDMLGTLSPDESARRDRLGERFGRGLGAADLAQLPAGRSPLAAVGPALRSPVPGAQAGGQPGININASAAIDPNAIAGMVVEKLKPVITAKIVQLKNQAGDHNYASDAGGHF